MQTNDQCAQYNTNDVVATVIPNTLLPSMQTQRLIAAMNAAALNGMVAANPGLMAGGLNPLMVAGGGAGLTGQPLFVQVSSPGCHFDEVGLKLW